MNTPNDDARCPDCGSTFTIDPDAEMGVAYAPAYHVAGQPLPVKMVRVTAAFCNGCERVQVLDPFIERSPR